MIRLHWVMEFQRRGVPHLHVAIWYEPHTVDWINAAPAERMRYANGIASVTRHNEDWQNDDILIAAMAVGDWIDIAEDFGAGVKGQHARPIIETVGWFQYLAKHCGRGKDHYQRQMESLPKQWDSSPRVWGKRGDWITEEPAEIQLTDREWFRLRRFARSWRVARARAKLPALGWESLPPLHTKQWARTLTKWPGSTGKLSLRQRLRHLQHARRMLSCNDPKLSAVRGINEWMDHHAQEDLHRLIRSMRR
jgi:hypothetical protein